VTASLLFVGESPPAGSPPDFRPFDCASGTRLASVLGLLDRATLLQHVPMANLFALPAGVKGAPGWDGEDAARAAYGLAVETRSIVTLGRRVADAFLLPTADARSRIPVPPVLAQWRHACGPLITYVPHPSGQSQALNDPATRTAVRRTLLPELVLGCPTLRPWHFRLDDPAVLLDLAVAVAPSCVAVGIAALVWARGQHVARTARLASPLLAKVDAALACPVVPPAWDLNLADVAMVLGLNNGARALAEAWVEGSTLHANAGNKWLLKLAEDHDALAATADRNVARATTLRYLLAER
jgi:hypothetical protein